MRNLLISDVLKETTKLNTKIAKIAYLKKNESAPLRDILRINFDADIISLLPTGAPPYKKDDMPDGHNYSTLHRQYRRFAYFFKGPYTAMSAVKRESMFVEMISMIHPDDAEMFIAAKDKNLKYKGLTKSLVMEAFPNLIRK